jgi:hypothetical protein
MKRIMVNATATDFIQVSEVELVYKSKIKASQRPQVSTSKEVYELFRKCWDNNKIEFVEQFKILLLNRANKVLGIYDFIYRRNGRYSSRSKAHLYSGFKGSSKPYYTCALCKQNSYIK